MVLGLVLKCQLIGGTLVGVSHDGLDLLRNLRELALPREFLGGVLAGTRVADLGGELGAVHLFEDDLRVLADFPAELLERCFEFDF